MSDATPASIEDCPPSTKLVYKVLEYEGPLTQADIRDETLLAQRTVYNALDELDELDLVESDPYSKDLRKSVYKIK